MSVDSLIQGLAISLSASSVYLLMALGLTLFFGVMQILNLAHGSVYMVGAFLTYYLLNSVGLHFGLAAVVAAAATAAAGIVAERVLYRPTQASYQATVLMFIALMLVVDSMGWLIFGVTPRQVSPAVQGVTSIAGAFISNYRLVLLLIVAVLTAGVYLLIYRTRIGLALRATEENQEAASLMGVDVHQVYRFVFILGFGLAGLAGALIAPLTVITPTMGLTPLLKAFVIVTVGGLGSVTGAVVASILIGLMDGVITVAMGASEAQLISLLLVILVLMIRPRGLMGKF